MKIVLYLLFSLGELFGVMVGASSDHREMVDVGLVVLGVICGIFALCAKLVIKIAPKIAPKKTLYREVAFLIAMGMTIVIVGIFCGICILIEAIIS